MKYLKYNLKNNDRSNTGLSVILTEELIIMHRHEPAWLCDCFGCSKQETGWCTFTQAWHFEKFLTDEEFFAHVV